MINVADGRGKSRAKIGKINRDKVENYYKENPGSNIINCCRALGLSYPAVKRHIKALTVIGRRSVD